MATICAIAGAAAISASLAVAWIVLREMEMADRRDEP
jgi:hypothetical protein